MRGRQKERKKKTDQTIERWVKRRAVREEDGNNGIRYIDYENTAIKYKNVDRPELYYSQAVHQRHMNIQNYVTK